MVTLRFPAGSQKELPEGTLLDAILPPNDLIVVFKDQVVDGQCRDQVVDRQHRLRVDAEVRSATPEELLDVVRHSMSHLMAHAVSRVFKDQNVLFAIGPTITEGFYYDFDLDRSLTPEDFEAIETVMRGIIAENLPLERIEMPKAGAQVVLETQKATYKIEMLVDKTQDGETTSFYKQGEFTDWCRGPHVPSTGTLKAYPFKLISCASAYWRGDVRRKQLQRIYATAFLTEAEMAQHLQYLADMEKNDHKTIGKALDLFSFHPEAQGHPFYHGDGVILFNTVVSYIKGLLEKRGYEEVKTPSILSSVLWHQSGHYDNFKERMYFTEVDGKECAIKPMSCPGGILIYNTKAHSYRDLPLRVSEWGLVHRHEQSGELNGLLRVRSFTQDDAHIYCTPDQLMDELLDLIDLTAEVYSAFGFTKYVAEISTKPEKAIGSDEVWAKAEMVLKEALAIRNIPYKINPGAGAFYGPKIDFHLEDARGRSWQCGTIQVDFSMPARFKMEYTDSEGKKQQPVMVHRAILGSTERFIGQILERSSGNMATWLMPKQVMILPVSDKFNEYAKSVNKALREEGVRSHLDLSDNRLGNKIRLSQGLKMPYVLVVGGKEQETGTVAVRRRDGRDLGQMPLLQFIESIKKEIVSRAMDLTIG